MTGGDGKMYDLAKAKTQQAMLSARDALSIDLWATTQATKKVLPLPVGVDSTSTVQDINSTTNTWWQAQQVTSGAFSTQGQDDMRNVRDLIMRAGQSGGISVGEIITTQLVYEQYEASQVSGIRYGSRDTADASFQALKWSTANVEFDPSCPTGQMFMLTSDALMFVVHSDFEWKVGNFIEPADQDARSAKVIWRGNLVVCNRRRLGKLVSIT